LVKVTSKIKAILADRDKEILSGQEAVAKILEETRRQILLELATLPGDGWSAHFLQQSLSAINARLNTWETATGRELGGRLSSTWESGAELLPTAMDAAGIRVSSFGISSTILDSLKEFAFGRISAVKGDLFNKIRGELTLGVIGQKTPQEVTRALMGDLADKPIPIGKWGKPVFKSVEERAQVITGTEMGRAFSLATQKSMDDAVDSVPELKKMWLHAGHPGVPRAIHLALHGQVRDMDRPFYSADGIRIMYPRDPNAPIKEVIRCGCTHIPYHPAFGDAVAFATDFDNRQLKMWKGEGRKAA
jgi:hypothetical protein